jgi:undecaprenyl-diphosphatase
LVPAVVAIANLLVVAGLAIAVSIGGLGRRSIDDRVERAAHRLVLHHHAVLVVARAVTRLGAPVVVNIIAVVVIAVLLLMRRPRAALFVAVIRVVTQVLTSGLKTVVDRPRPSFAHAVAHAGGASFPSGHASGAASVYLPLAVLVVAATSSVLVCRSAVLSAVTICLVVAASRVLLGVHYVSDVVAGLCLGAAVTAGAVAMLGMPVIRRGSETRGAEDVVRRV